MSEFSYGDIHYIDRFETCGSEQYPGRPAVIVSNEAANRHSATVEVVYLTTQPKENLPTHVTIYSTGKKSTVLCEQITTVDISRVKNYVCTVTPGELMQIERALFASIGFRYLSIMEKRPALPADEPNPEKLKEQIDLLESKVQNLQTSNQRLNEDLIRYRTTARIYERIYTDLVAPSKMQKEEEDE